MLEPLEQRPRSVSAADALRRAILDGRFAPGTQIREVPAAAQLGVSRGPLRVALQELEDEGLVVRHAYRGSFVAEIGAETVEEIASLRVRLEPFALELATPHFRTETGATELRARMSAIEAAVSNDDVAGSIDAHMALHRLIYERARHRLLLDSWRSWESQLRLYFAIDHTVFTGFDALLVDHAHLVELIETGQPDEIAAEIRRHVEGAAHAVSRSDLVHPETSG